MSATFPLVAGLAGDPRSLSRWWGVADVGIALVLVILAFAIVGQADGRVTARVTAASYRVYRVLLHAILLLLVVFFLVGDRVLWVTWLTGFAWRAWLLLYTLPAWLAVMESGEARGLPAVVTRGLSAHYERVQGKVHVLVDPLTSDQLWQRAFPYGNSIGHLLLHLTGNLRYYVGARMAGTGYVRDRPREFSDPDRRPKDEVLREFDDAVAMVLAALAAQSAEDWHAAYEAVGAEGVEDRFGMFVRCAAHADHHLGQMIYLCKQLSLEIPGGCDR